MKSYNNLISVRIVAKEYERENPDYMIVSKQLFKELQKAIKRGYNPPCLIFTPLKDFEADVINVKDGGNYEPS